MLCKLNLPDSAQDYYHDNIMACKMQMKVSINVLTVYMNVYICFACVHVHTCVSTIHVLSTITGFKADTHNMQRTTQADLSIVH